MSKFMDRARAEAEREVAKRNRAAFEHEGEYLSSAWCQGFEWGFTKGAAWADEQGASATPERFRDDDELARFVIENEWALESKVNPSGRADWRETLNRVYDAWDSETPFDIVSTIVAAVRLDRSLRGKERVAQVTTKGDGEQ